MSSGPTPRRLPSAQAAAAEHARDVGSPAPIESPPVLPVQSLPSSTCTSWGPTPRHASCALSCVAEPELDVESEVALFLRDSGFERHVAVFLQNGVDELETLLALDDRDLEDLGLAAFQRRRLLRCLEELRSQVHAESHVTHPVAQFLSDIGFGQYADLLLRNGFDDMETLGEIEDADLRDFGMPRGHIIKLRKKLREHRIVQQGGDEALRGAPRSGGIAQSAAAAPQQRLDPDVATCTAKLPQGCLKTAVEQSWERVQALGPVVIGDMLYHHVLALAPEAAALFPYEVRVKYLDWSSVDDESDIYNSPAMRRLYARIVNAVGSCVMGLTDPMTMVPWLLQLGGRHISYGASPEGWEIVGKALQLTLRDALGAAYTADVEEAWQRMCCFISYVMIEGLRRATEAAASAQEQKGCLATDASSTAGASVSGESETSEGSV